jgi:hypothetical protein
MKILIEERQAKPSFAVFCAACREYITAFENGRVSINNVFDVAENVHNCEVKK